MSEDKETLTTEHPLYREVYQIFLDYMNDVEASEIAASAVISGTDPHWREALLENLLGIALSITEANMVWIQGVAHWEDMRRLLGRDPGLSVAFLDHCRNFSTIVPTLRLTSANSGASTVGDGLSGLSAFRYFKSRLDSESARSERYKNRFVVGLLQIDNFQKLVDDRGLEACSTVIHRLGKIINATIRQTDVATRIGRHQIALLLPETNKQGGFVQLERMRTLAEIDLKEFQTTLSGGLAEGPADAASSDGLLNAARESTLAAQSQGGNRVCIDPKERRAFPRLNESLLVRITPLAQTDQAREAITLDISGGGFCFENDQSFELGKPIKGEIELPNMIVSFLGRIVRCDEINAGRFSIGICFTAIDPESRYQLLAFTR